MSNKFNVNVYHYYSSNIFNFSIIIVSLLTHYYHNYNIELYKKVVKIDYFNITLISITYTESYILQLIFSILILIEFLMTYNIVKIKNILFGYQIALTIYSLYNYHYYYVFFILPTLYNLYIFFKSYDHNFTLNKRFIWHMGIVSFFNDEILFFLLQIIKYKLNNYFLII